MSELGFGAFWLAMAVVWVVMARLQAGHKAWMEGHNQRYAEYDWFVPHRVRGPLFEYILAAAYTSVAAGYFAQALFS